MGTVGWQVLESAVPGVLYLIQGHLMVELGSCSIDLLLAYVFHLVFFGFSYILPYSMETGVWPLFPDYLSCIFPNLHMHQKIEYLDN